MPTRSPDPFAAIGEALMIEPDELASLREQAMRDPVRGGPMVFDDGDEIEPGDWRVIADANGLPPNCPVKPLGIDKLGAYFLNPMGQVVCLTASASGKGPIDFLFAGRTAFLEWAWPRWTGEGAKREVKGYEADEARRNLVDAAAWKGTFDDLDRVRGRGAWTHFDGSLIYHAGDRVWFEGRWRPTGEHLDWVFPGRRAVMTPWPHPVDDGEGSPAHVILLTLQTWNFQRGELDARLLLGWVCAAMIGGALEWRPLAFLSGDQETGKSSLQRLIKALLGGLLVQSVNTTAAGIYQKVQHDSAPVAVDEFESEADTRAADAVVKLARQAASGGLLLRGGSDHNGKEFQARSAFIFSAINPPPLNSQDQSRIANLVLRPLAELRREGEEPALAPPVPDNLEQVARQLLKRMFDAWPRFNRVLRAYKAALMKAGHTGRAGDQFGTLAAAFHVASYDRDPDPTDLAWWTDHLAVDTLAETANFTPNWRSCLNHMLDAQPEVLRSFRTSIRSVGQAVEIFKRTNNAEDLIDVGKMLGLAVSWRKGDAEVWDNARLFVPATHPAVMRLFEGSQWAGRPGAAGVWASALRQGPPGVVYDGKCDKGLDTKRAGVFVELAKVFGD
ncbi:MAG: hypothetical protein DI570_09255 [Phenylobacterium zucineum]|nr:MAG: hypothetical protein DI570_09255 [Phenylobacterium zucineum]